MKKNFLARIFEGISEALLGAEKSFLDLLSALVPYCVPVIPAYLTFYHTWQMMDFPTWVAWTAAFVVEALGLASVSTAIRFYRNNIKYKKVENKAPFKLALFIYIFYLVIVLLVNVILEIVAGTRGGWIIVAIGLFTLLGVPSGVLISIRSQFSEMLEERAYRHTIAHGEQLQPKQGMGFSAYAKQKHASDYKEKILGYLDTAYATKGEVLMPRDVTAKLEKDKIYLDHSKSKGFISTLTAEWKRSKGIQD